MVVVATFVSLLVGGKCLIIVIFNQGTDRALNQARINRLCLVARVLDKHLRQSARLRNIQRGKCCHKLSHLRHCVPSRLYPSEFRLEKSLWYSLPAVSCLPSGSL